MLPPTCNNPQRKVAPITTIRWAEHDEHEQGCENGIIAALSNLGLPLRGRALLKGRELESASGAAAIE